MNIGKSNSSKSNKTGYEAASPVTKANASKSGTHSSLLENIEQPHARDLFKTPHHDLSSLSQISSVSDSEIRSDNKSRPYNYREDPDFQAISTHPSSMNEMAKGFSQGLSQYSRPALDRMIDAARQESDLIKDANYGSLGGTDRTTSAGAHGPYFTILDEEKKTQTSHLVPKSPDKDYTCKQFAQFSPHNRYRNNPIETYKEYRKKIENPENNKAQENDGCCPSCCPIM